MIITSLALSIIVKYFNSILIVQKLNCFLYYYDKLNAHKLNSFEKIRSLAFKRKYI